MRIGELAEATGATVRALRYYEEQGLLEPERTASGQRVYAADAVEQVRWIRHLLAAGLPSRAIVKLRRCDTRHDITPEEKAVIQEERDRVEAEFQALAASRARFDAMMAFVNGDNESQAEAALPMPRRA